VRVVAYLFIAAALVVVAVTSTATQPLIYVLAGAGLFLVVVGQEMLPASMLGGRRLAVEAATMIVFVSILILLTGGYQSPFFVGYVLVVGATSLWGDSDAPLLLAAASCVAYLATVFATPYVMGGTFPPEALAHVAFVLVAIGLVAYVSAVISREQRRSGEAVLALSRFDPLTGLFSRSFFERALEQETLRAGRSGRAFSLLLLDLDSLKQVNDNYGHESGDRLLDAIGEVIWGDVRATDIAARLGGDEFVIILPETDLSGSLRVADKLRRDIGHLSLPTAGTLVSSSVSIGVAMFPDDARNAAEMLRRADQAMYQAKRRGKDQIYHYARPTVEIPPPPAPPPVDWPAASTAEVQVDAMGAPPATMLPEAMPDDAAEVGAEPVPWDEAVSGEVIEGEAIAIPVEADQDALDDDDTPWLQMPPLADEALDSEPGMDPVEDDEDQAAAVVTGAAPWE
jgi:diguanylate cyclase (GGDEF)-like protein